MRIKALLIATLLTIQFSANNLRVTFDYKVFYVPGEGNMIECYFNFEGNSINFIPVEEGYKQGQIESTLILKRFQDIIDFEKSIVKSPEISGKSSIDFYDQKRLIAPDGDYILEIELKDVNNPDSEIVKHELDISIRNPKNKTFVSDIQLVAGYAKAEGNLEWSKSGYDIIPYLSSHYGQNFDELLFYSEVYNSNKEMGEKQDLLLSYFIEDLNSEEVVSDIIARKRIESAEVIPVFSKLNITDLASGKYNFVVEVRNRNNEVIAQKKRVISRNNPISPNIPAVANLEETFADKFVFKDTLLEHIHSLRPIASNLERTIIENYPETYTLRNLKTFFYNFWKERNPINPEDEWEHYKTQVEKVEELFATRHKKGWQTDRGYVYLKYGPPNTVVDKTREEGAYPYYIWHYYKAGKFNNGRFVFYNKEFAREDYELLHSNVRGERRNDKWNVMLHSRNTPDLEFFRGNNTPDINSGTDADEFFTNPW
ncbi:MAG: GWxTD domain-containing protein [Bacteroidota bacterium]